MKKLKTKNPVRLDSMSNETGIVFRSFRNLNYNNERGFYKVDIISFTEHEVERQTGEIDEDGNMITVTSIERNIFKKYTETLTKQEAQAMFTQASGNLTLTDFTEFIEDIIINLIIADTLENSYYGITDASELEIIN